MHQYLNSILSLYFKHIDQIGIPGVGVLLALFVPGELIIPPAAYVEVHAEAHGMQEVILATVLLVMVSAIGYTVGTALLYWLSRGIGRPLVLRYGKYIFLTEKKLKVAEEWMSHHGMGGILFCTLIPGVRHAICVPAGIVGMRFRSFILAVFGGALIWCTVLSVFGLVMSKQMEAVVHASDFSSPAYRQAMHTLTLATGGMVVFIVLLYLIAMRRTHKPKPVAPAEESQPVE